MIDVTVTLRDGRTERVRRVAPIQNKRAAERYELELRQELIEGRPDREEESQKTKEPCPTLAEFCQPFLDVYSATNNKPAGLETKRIVCRTHLVPALGSRRLDQIGVQEIEAFKAAKLRDGYAAKSVNNFLAVLQKLLKVAVDWEKLEHAPRVQWLKVPDPEFDFFSFEEAERLVAGAPSEWRAMVVVGLRTGLRIGELLALRWDDVDLVAGRLMVRRSVSSGIIGTPKNGRSREVPLSDQALAALKGHRHLRGELVFCGEDGRLLNRGECKWPLWRACQKAGLRRVGWHALRHTFASHLAMRGVPLKAVQELLGHSTMDMTMRYAHLSPDVRRDSVRLLDGQGTYAAHEPREQRN
ncbi:MAG TPA: tyrosine-type recombinase/integrase [Polyangiaceae bacterium]|nr:tyrosine-type recombinase/integrase [Polyangiaceae bacterium]